MIPPDGHDAVIAIGARSLTFWAKVHAASAGHRTDEIAVLREGGAIAQVGPRFSLAL